MVSIPPRVRDVFREWSDEFSESVCPRFQLLVFAVVTGTAHWYKSGAGLVPVRWVVVEDRTGTHRDEYFFTTDITLTPHQIIEAYTGRWAIEVKFEEVREHVGLETTRGRCAHTILHAEPCLFGLDTLVALWFAELPETMLKNLSSPGRAASSRR